MLKGTKFYSIFTGACARCQQESMYQTKNPYVLSDVLKINDNCSQCNLQYRLEPSFFYGSMYVSYGVGIAFAVPAFLISYLVFESSLVTAFIAIVVTMFAFGPIIMRLSRNIWINLFVNYDKTKINK
jgi:Ca2+-dependent lipid-binding protein